MSDGLAETMPEVQLRSEESVYQTLRQILADVLCVDQSRVTREADIADDLGAESIDFVDMSFRIEQEFTISFSLDDLKATAGNARRYPVQLLVDFVMQCLKTAPGKN
jgi:acyl carrier protein